MRHILLTVLLGACAGTTTEPKADPVADEPADAPAADPAKAPAAEPIAETIATSAGDLVIRPLYHATLVLEHGGKTVVVDAWSKAKLDGIQADVVLITDLHPDHLDVEAIKKVAKPDAVVVGPQAVADQTAVGVVIANGETKEAGGLQIEAVPMYNLERGPEPGKLFHEKGRGNGYVVTFGDKRVYLSGDTECTPEMKALKDIDVAFVSMNLPYTMPPTEAAECVKAFAPDILYPYHYADSNLAELETALQGTNIEVRKREWYPGGLPF